MRRLGLRDRLTIVVVVGAALALSALTLGFNLVLRSSLDHDANQVLDARAAASLAAIEVDHGVVKHSEAPDAGAVDALVWVYSGNGAVERPRTAPSLQREADSLAGGPRGFAEDSRSDVRLLAEPIVRGGQRVGTVVVGISLEPYEHSASQAFIASLVFAVVIFLLVVLATRLVIGGALRPVARMTAEAADWSEHDLDHRFHAGEPHDELTRLAATFDSMLDGLAASLRHERRFSAEVSHEIRTPLAAIVAEADLATRRERRSDEYREALTTIADRARQLERVLDTLLAVERAGIERVGTADAVHVAEEALAACRALAESRGVQVFVRGPNALLRVGVDTDAAERVLVPLIENACRYARTRVEITVRANGDRIVFLVTDDGAGVEPGEAEAIFEPGHRGSAGLAADERQNGHAPGAGLGLALSRRLARATDGDVRWAASESGFVFNAPRG